VYIATDLGSAADFLSDCKRQFEKLRADAEAHCLKPVLILPPNIRFRVDFRQNATGRRKCTANWQYMIEIECLSGKERMKVNVFIAVIDVVVQQLQSRFSEQNIAFIKQLSFFTPAGLLSSSHSDVSIDVIAEVCDQYGLNAVDVHRELKDFRYVYKVCSSNL